MGGPGGPPAGGRVPLVTNQTAAVQVGTRSQIGISSERKLGRKAQCQPSSQVSARPTPTSRASLTGESAPQENEGNTTICARSASIAPTEATGTAVGPSGVVSVGEPVPRR